MQIPLKVAVKRSKIQTIIFTTSVHLEPRIIYLRNLVKNERKVTPKQNKNFPNWVVIEFLGIWLKILIIRFERNKIS